MSIRVLLVEDDHDFRDSLQTYLTDVGLDVRAVADAEGLEREMESAVPDVVVLDLNLPGTDGLAAALAMRKASNVGIVVLTGRTDKQDRFQGLAIGVDHYLSKPTDPAELELVIRNLHRRLGPSLPARADAGDADAWVFHATEWTLASPDGTRIKLSSTEFQLLLKLVARPGAPVPRTDLLPASSRQDEADVGRGLDLIVFRLRRKVEKACGRHLPVVSARGKGYVFAGKIETRPAAGAVGA